MAGFAINGDVRDLSGVLMPSATVTWSGTSSGTVVTNGAGHYSFTVVAGGTYTVSVNPQTIAGSFHFFSPDFQTVTIAGTTTLADFVEYSFLDGDHSLATSVIGMTNNNGLAIVVNWGSSISSDVRVYVVDAAQETAQGSGVENTYAQVAVVFAPTTNVRITGLEGTVNTGKRYRFRVKAVDSGNNSSPYLYSGWTNIIDDATPPAKPTGLTGTTFLDDDTHTLTAVVNLTWNRNTERDLSNYVISWISPDGGVTSLPVPNYATTYRVAGLKVGKVYDFSIVAYDFSQNRSEVSSTFTVTTPSVTTVNAAAGAPTQNALGLSYPTVNLANITVNIQAGTGITTAGHYSIFRSTALGTEGTQVGSLAVAASTAAGTAASLVETVNRTYSDQDTIDLYYKVRFVDNNGITSPASVQQLITITGTYNDNIGDPRCPTIDMYLTPTLKVRDAKVGDLVIGLTDGISVTYPILSIDRSIQPCVRLKSANGAVTEVSCSTPVELSNGESRLAGDMLGFELATLVEDKIVWSHCTGVEDIGEKEVAYIYLGKKTYATGCNSQNMVFTHNSIMK